LDLDFNERNARLLGFDHSGCVSVDVEEIIGKAMAGRQLEFADRDTAGGFDVDAVAILDQPAGGDQEAVDVSAGTVLGFAPGMALSLAIRSVNSQHSAG
jgi:hypothetical protein